MTEVGDREPLGHRKANVDVEGRWLRSVRTLNRHTSSDA
jgi:hypothetical protein